MTGQSQPSPREAMREAVGESRRAATIQAVAPIVAAAIGGICTNPKTDAAMFTPSGVAAFIVATAEHLVNYVASGAVPPESVEGEMGLGG